MKTSSPRTYTKFHLRLFWSVFAIILITGLFFAGFHYIRETRSRIEMLRDKLTWYNDYIYERLKYNLPVDSLSSKEFIRISIFDFAGNMLYDSDVPDLQNVENHSSRKELIQALESGIGYEVRRRSTLTGEIYFYSAKKYDNCIIRSAAPYTSNFVSDRKIDLLYISVIVIILLIFLVVFYNMMRHLGDNMNRLSDFVTKAENEDVDEYPVHFSNNEVGEISRHVVQIYNRLQKTKQALVAEQQRVQEQQEEQGRIKRTLTQNIAHELKTPVSSIQGYLETIINNKSISPDVLEKFIEKCYQQSTRLSSLLHDISTLTRIDEASELISKERVDLAKLIADILDDTALSLKEKNIRVFNRTKDLSLVCEGNQSLLYSVFRNLVDNTIAYAGDGVDVHIACKTDNPQIYRFSYSDNGVGIPKEHLERIFDRFYRIDKGRSRKLGGTGLGLSIVKNAIILHGGTISARQRAEGGVEFVFSIRR